MYHWYVQLTKNNSKISFTSSKSILLVVSCEFCNCCWTITKRVKHLYFFHNSASLVGFRKLKCQTLKKKLFLCSCYAMVTVLIKAGFYLKYFTFASKSKGFACSWKLITKCTDTWYTFLKIVKETVEAIKKTLLCTRVC